MITARKEEKKMLPIYKYSVSDITKDEVKTITEKKRKPINIHTLSCTFQGKKNTTCVVGDEQLDEVKKNGYFEQKKTIWSWRICELYSSIFYLCQRNRTYIFHA